MITSRIFYYDEIENTTFRNLRFIVKYIAFATIYENSDDADAAIDKIYAEIEVYARKKYHLDVVGTGVSFPNGNLKGMGFSFQIDHQLPKEEAKAIVLDLAHLMKNKVNDDVVLVKFIENAPFTIANITINLFFTDRHGNGPVHPDYVVAALTRAKFETQTQESPDSFKFFCTTVEEIEVD